MGTQRAITRPSDNAVVWRWDNSDPFSGNLPNENPSGLGNFVNNNRGAGQYYDQETGLIWNGYRVLDKDGRYIQSDPIGLRGGLSTYGHLGNSPLDRTDPKGLSWSFWCVMDPGNMDCYDPDKYPAPRPDYIPPDKPQDPRHNCIIKCVLIGSAQSNIAERATAKGMGVVLDGAKEAIKAGCHFIVKRVFTLYEGYHIYHCYESCQECPAGNCPEPESKPLTDFTGPRPYIGNPNLKPKR